MLIVAIPIILNTTIGIVSIVGIYMFSESILWSIVGGFIIGSMSFTAAIIYPIVEYYFTNAITGYSYTIIGISILLLLWVSILSLLSGRGK